MHNPFYSGKDQLGFTVALSKRPERIISLVPSQTELLFDLGMENEIVGVTKFCVHPFEKCKSKVSIGGTIKFNFKIIDQLNPDLIIGNKEENYKEGIEVLQKQYPVWVSDIGTLKEAYIMMKEIGIMVGKTKEAECLVNLIDQRFITLLKTPFKPKQSVLYLIWKNPFMSIGNDTFIHHLLSLCGFENVLQGKTRYPQLEVEEIKALAPDFVFLSSEPYPFNESHKIEIGKLFPESEVVLVDGEMFSWYGSRLRYAASYFTDLLHLLPKG